MSSSAPDDDALRRQFYGARDIRSLYPRVTDNHLRYLEKWGLIRQAAHSTTERFYSFTDLSRLDTAWKLSRDGNDIASGTSHPALAPRTRREYAVHVARFAEWLAVDAARAREARVNAHARDYAVRDFKRHLKLERRWAPDRI